MSEPENGPQLPAICWPVPKNNRGGEFSNLEEMLAHLEGEATGHWLIGRNGMWHGGIHITDTTTPWCALSGQAMNEAVDFPVPFKGEQAVRCMADGEVVAYRINRDYLSVPWYWGDLRYSGSFVLVRHCVQPGETAESGLTFYTLYMHLAPWLAYPEQDSTAFKVADGQHLNAYMDVSRQVVVAELPPGTRVIWDKAVSADTMAGSNGRQYAYVTLAEPVTGRMSLKAGDRVWTVCDKGNLVPAPDSAARPAWWSPFLPPSRETVQFDTVVCPDPYPVKAGDPVGHLGYFQVPTEDGHEKRYQVHIECLTPDDLPRFLSNLEGVGRDTPAFARCPKGIPVYLKVTGGEIQKGRITTQSETVMALSGQAVTDKEGKRYWPGGASRGLLAESDVQLLSRYDLAGRGFEATEDSPVSFDHLDGERQPKGLVRTIFERFFSVADDDDKLYSPLEAFNYRQLLNQIDDAKSPRYNPEQYRRAVQNPSMRAHLYRLCVKHPSEWYYSSESPVWKAFFTPQLKRDAPEWHAYSMKFLTDLRWMYRVAGMVENPWHMHPLVFLDAIKCRGYDFSTRAGTIRAIIEESRKQGFSLNSQIAYILATVKRETGDTFQPVREGDWGGHISTDEYRKKHYRYYPYYGRGYVQITWDYNYKAYSEKLGVDLVSDPDRALEPNNSLFILIDGFKNGVFTGKKLTDYVSKDSVDFLNARRCINGLDHAEQIKGFAEVFLSKLDARELI
ncbi:hypothetical protein CRT22_24545 [Escherichia sp. E5028]|uniref:hypothetical protein n=1 Tax=Escherichia sp. E5028 TaxID=2044602 RepID=UPI00107F33C2|nr:hypothetical protein [Escherichia sp. E5028]TGB52644.1 hypothetical protein CRT22_24545 [Escherichia sp. E5028]